jgi:CelD/BcsL family acetyltransferase involved in cellulose biosynthesis
LVLLRLSKSWPINEFALRIVVHREIPDDPELQQQWNALVQEMDRPEVFYTHQWALAAGRSFGESVSPLLVLAYEAEKLTGVAALATDSVLRTASFLAATSADYCDLLGHPRQRAELLEAVLEEACRAGMRGIVLTSLPADSATISTLRSTARKRGYYLFQRPNAVCAQVDLGQQEERIQLKTALRKKKVFRYSMNVLGREGPVSFCHLASWEEIEPALASFGVAHVARFLSMGRISNVVSARRRAFLYELARSLAESGWLVLSRMLVGDRPIAWNYGFQFQGSWFWYQPTFDTTYERFSPGYCLLSEIVSEACDRADTRVVDLGLGAEGYKARFANNARTTLQVHLTKSLGRHMRETMRTHVGRAVKSVAWVEAAVRTVMSYLGDAGRAVGESGLLGLAERAKTRATSWLNHRQEVIFYRWMDRPTEKRSQAEMNLQPIDLETLANAAMIYEDEADTLSYLLRSAGRLQTETGSGFAVLDADRTPVHFGWVSDFDGFEMKELKTRLSAPLRDAAMIFDSWTPRSRRGQGYYGIALSLVAQRVAEAGKEAWIFTAAANHSSQRGIEKVGFERKYSLICRKTFAWQRIAKVAFDGPGPTTEARAGS